MDAAPLYWDPTPVIRHTAGTVPGILGWSGTLPALHEYRGQWAERNWRNVPGPIYAAATDTCWASHMWAPHHITYENETGQEFLFRQPRSQLELLGVLCGAAADPFGAWAVDGDEHWTPELVRIWWRDRSRLAEWMRTNVNAWAESPRSDEREAATGITEYAAYLEHGLEDQLRAYLFWQEERRPPAAHERLPTL